MDRSTEPTPSDAPVTPAPPDGHGRHRAVGTRRRRRLLALLIGLAAAVLVLDQVVKQVAVTRLEPGQYVPILGDFLGFSLVFNSGAAFSFAEGSTWIFTIAAVLVTAVIVVVARRLGSLAWAIALGALLGGNLGNLADRLLREPGFGKGHVVDMINYNNWFVGNVADIAIVLSAIAIAVLTFRGLSVDGRRVGAGGAAVTDEPGDDEQGVDGASDAEASDAGATDAGEATTAVGQEPDEPGTQPGPDGDDRG